MVLVIAQVHPLESIGLNMRRCTHEVTVWPRNNAGNHQKVCRSSERRRTHTDSCPCTDTSPALEKQLKRLEYILKGKCKLKSLTG